MPTIPMEMSKIIWHSRKSHWASSILPAMLVHTNQPPQIVCTCRPSWRIPRGSGILQLLTGLDLAEEVKSLRIPSHITIYLLAFYIVREATSRILTISTVTKFPALFLPCLVSLEDDINSVTLGFNIQWRSKSITTVRTKLLVSCNELKRNEMMESEERKN